MEKICNKTQEQIREAYFKRKVDSLLNDIQAEKDWGEDELKKLEIFLDSLRKEQIEKHKRFALFLEGTEIRPPTVEELSKSPSSEQQAKIDEWLINAKKCSDKCLKIMQIFRERILKGEPVKRDEWLDAASEISALMPTIDQDRVYKDQQYRRVLTSIIDTYSVSRAEAEERAKLTKEYRDYKLATLFRENLEEYIMLAKKYYSPNF